MNRMISAALMLLASLQSSASTFSTDYSDLWFNSNEAGWGANVIQQDNTLFATLFVYSTTGAPSWYVASAARYTGQQGNSLVFSGPLYQTSGPYFGGAFNPSTVGVRQVGTATFTFANIGSGTLSYSVDGVSVTKSISRQTWANNNLSGAYMGASLGTFSGCILNGYFEDPALITINHSGSSITISTAGITATCTYSGTYQQVGRMGAIDGSVLCSNGNRGTFAAFELEASISGLTGRATASLGGTCTWSGRIGGLRRFS